MKLFSEQHKILLAVSGGKDSIVMLECFRKVGVSIGVAHCNFKLRGVESDEDELFVRDLAQEYGIPYFCKTFDIKKHLMEDKGSVQMKARELRYAWFEEVSKENEYDFVATAHHRDDVAETMLINLVNGTGVSGLHGIRSKVKNIIRPMLCFSRKEINQFITDYELSYREDSSNSDTKYVRNRIRRNIIPELREINPSLIDTLNKEAEIFYELETIINEKVDAERQKCVLDKGDQIQIDIKVLRQLNPLRTYLYYFLNEFGFNISDVNDIIRGLDGQSGLKYYSKTHILTKDRGMFILKKLDNSAFERITINSMEELPFQYTKEVVSKDFKIEKDNHLGYFDADKIAFPLVLRKWRYGDSFFPYGLGGRKKVSDFLIDNKVPVIEKSKVRILESEGQIIWIVGYRIDDRFKVTTDSKSVIILSS